MLAIIESEKYLELFVRVKIVTDSAAFQKTLEKKELAPKVSSWALFLEEFNHEIVHRSGNFMRHVDVLSRNTVLMITDPALHKRLYLDINTNTRTQDESQEQQIDRKETNTSGLFGPEVTSTREGKKISPLQFPVGIKSLTHGKGKGFLNPIPKENIPLNIYYIDFIGPLPSTNKRYQHIVTVVDVFTKFTWFYPVKSPFSQEAIDKLKLQQTIFGNPSRIITDKGSVFTANEFETYCSEEGIQHLTITTGIPRGNGQIERKRRTLSHDDPMKSFRHFSNVQRVINSSTSR
ncbi:hypothetical protein AVEN_226266-1 [Araneus ventricosus]|uniref:Integrase catalytic domain-containing protein n=1 Tax=Araneus ventricosus TaxID=182803 RepID=A0A4Y2DAZ2_ARAVE|nr:hypothetical protein AVEN_226266-1 [Araneus ventricosus]